MSRETSLSGDERGETSAVRMLLAWFTVYFHVYSPLFFHRIFEIEGFTVTGRNGQPSWSEM